MADQGLANVTPLQRSAAPVGTLAELQKEGLDPSQYASCARPNKALGIAGCAWFENCRVSAKGESGPRNYGVKIIKGRGQGGGISTASVDCMWIADHTERIEANKGTIMVVADEGQEFDRITGVLVNNQTGKETFSRDRDAHVEDRRVKVKVRPFPRPGENPALLQDVLRAETIQMEKERIANEARLRSLGLDAAVPAIDKRDAGRDEGRSAKGGSKP